MQYSVYRFNYNSDQQTVEFPIGDPIPPELVQLVILPNRFLIEQDCFELLRVRYKEGVFIIHKYPDSPVMIGQKLYYFTLRCS